ncbi:uncharacterized protein ColSpa_12240 [Colletotrichum spaethianum]|uniref:SET domain-containing protein n=1 Tax=Colletotrichum spaethianum TaxID=700344 RepID=A0AA37PH53_9PEZI|nr:uncharacterized protein ColSpa_12240 [Colletotrichum spaethianum]GKT52059.1 hypothetical protein ColSpa_12240 [Colletotrichum spaethianum]
MDIKDVSGIEEFSAFFQQLQVTAEKARGRKGQIPHDHPLPSMLVSQFNMELIQAIAMSTIDNGRVNIKTSQVPPAYIPCSRPANELEPLSISKMRQRPEKALLDAISSRSNGIPTEKGLFREAKAYYALQQFDRCAKKLQQVLVLNPDNKDAETDLERTGRRIFEQVTGDFKWKHMHKQSEATPPMIDCATYSSPVEVRASPGRGRGLFTAKAVKTGELLLCEKAFSYVYADQNDPSSRKNVKILMNLDSKKMTMGGQATLISTIVQKLHHNPEAASHFMSLHHGDYNGVKTAQRGQLVVDTFLVERIINLNCFGAPRSTLESMKNKANQVQEDNSYTTCGIWTTASFINHSCVGNCYRSFIGDMMIVRACRDLDAGTELLFSYELPKEGADYQATQNDLKHWGFVCRCELCEEKKETSQPMFQKRQRLVRDLKNSMRACRAPAQEAKVLRLLSQVEDTYPGGKGTLRLDIWEVYLALGQKRADRGKLAEGLELMIKGLEALGFEVVAFPPGKPSGKPTLEIKKWGQVNDYLVSAFLAMFHAYKVLAPELCEVAKGYAETVYVITHGEKDTIGTLFEEFK